MDLEILLTFLSVIETQNFTKSAEDLFCTQAAVSMRIQRLEKFLGVKVFERSGKKVVPTKAGQTFLHYAKQVVSTIEEAKKQVAASQLLENSTISIASSHTPGSYLLPNLICEFNKEYPNIKVMNNVQYTKNVIKSIINKNYEIGFISQPNFINTDILDCKPITDDPLTLVVSPNHHWVKRESIYINEISNETFLLSNPNSSLIHYIEDKGRFKFEQNKIVVMGNLEGIKQSIRSNFGVSIISKYAVSMELSLGLLKEIMLIENINLSRKIYYIKRKAHKLSPASSVFLSSVIKTLG